MAASLGTLTLDLMTRIGQFVQPLKQAKASMNAIERQAAIAQAGIALRPGAHLNIAKPLSG